MSIYVKDLVIKRFMTLQFITAKLDVQGSRGVIILNQ
jgi:hypothetical protein